MTLISQRACQRYRAATPTSVRVRSRCAVGSCAPRCCSQIEALTRVARSEQRSHEVGQRARVLVVEGREAVAVDVEDGADGAAGIEHGHDDL